MGVEAEKRMGAEAEKRMVAEDEKPQVTDQLLGGTAIKPVGWDRKGWEAIKYVIWNPDTGAVLTRTPLSWLKIITFYTIYYSCLAGFWAGCMAIFFQTLPIGHPRWMLNDSIIGVNPGLGAKPNNADKRIDSAIYQFNIQDKTEEPTNDLGEGFTNADWVRRLDIFLDNTGIRNANLDVETCENNESPMDVHNENWKNCKFLLEDLGDCAISPYGYIGDKIEPCIFLKFNKIFNWEPITVNYKELSNKKYKAMSADLKQHIKDAPDKNHVWIDCHGRYPADIEALKGNMEYFPKTKGIPIKYFPFVGKGKDYGVPLVAVKFTNIPTRQLVHVECKAWFHGVKHVSRDKVGLTQFEILILDEKPKEEEY